MPTNERYITVEDAAKQIEVQPITLRHWLAIGTMPQFVFEDTEYVLQEDVDAFNEACLCRNQRVDAERRRMRLVAS
ncbi:MAG: hypothetical protein FJZ47_20895 [Candidatus Tectomicrobia bacterium]|uniref:Helix-turn-helix domain-containing protein n=1 Tax=Tectimicrobiota bacterium TaxID=2528274 RepID=A0A938B4M5_UNCTE|nr:hypothetical protein [Candidatus Tectomicrobia bacterium]